MFNDIKKITPDVTEFLAMLAHDMKNPVKAQLRGINLLYSGIFGEFSEEAKNLILNIIASNKYLECLLDDILNQYRINGDSFNINKNFNDLRKTLEEALCNIGILSEVKGQKIIINYNTDNFVKNYDEVQIQRVIINLLSNAFKYAKENSQIIINIQKKGNNLEFLMENERISKLSDNYFKDGCGLGLIICNKIIEAHNGIMINEINETSYISGFTLP